MKNNTQKRIEIPLVLEAGSVSGDESQQLKARIETTAIHIQSIFNLIKVSLYGLETTGMDNVDGYLEDVSNISEIGAALANSISNAVAEFPEVIYERAG